jgi:putative drug exporter of the RND superfamily
MGDRSRRCAWRCAGRVRPCSHPARRSSWPCCACRGQRHQRARTDRGVGVALAMLTLLPAALVVGGRRAFWPFVPRYGSEGADETHGAWRRVGERVAAAPRRVWITTVLLLGLGCIGLTSFSSGLTNTQNFRGSVQSVDDQRLIARAFPAGANAPTDVVVRDAAAVPSVQQALRSVPGVAAVGPPEHGRPGARFAVTLTADPYSTPADNLIPRLRAAAHAASPSALVGGPTAQQKDFDTAAAHDNRLIVPIVLVLVFVILALLLRAVTLPLPLIGTVILSFGAALGVSSAVFDSCSAIQASHRRCRAGLHIPRRARGRLQHLPDGARPRGGAPPRHAAWDAARAGGDGRRHHLGGRRARGTLTMLATLPLKTLTELGFTIAFGVLLDTFIVRSVLVPALIFDLGPRVWWLSAVARNEETRCRRAEADSVQRTDERYPERPAALAASDTPDGSS